MTRNNWTILRNLALGSTALVAVGAAGAGQVVAADVGVPHYAVGDRISALEAELKKLKESYVRRGKKNVELTVSGQVNRGVLFFDDGEETDKAFVDNDNSSTRFRLEGRAKINDYWSAGANIEVEMESNSTGVINQRTNTAGQGLRGVGGTLAERKLEVYLDRKFSDNARARLWTGQGDTASNGTSEVDLSGTGVIAYSQVADTAGGLIFRTGAGALGAATVGGVFNNLDGLSRDDRTRLDIAVGPVMLSGSAVARNRYDAAIRFDHTFNNTVHVAAAGGIANTPTNGEDGAGNLQYSGSVSILHIPTGISLTGAAGARDFDASATATRSFFYGKLAVMHSIFEVGKSGAAIDYFYTEDTIAAGGDDGNAFGVALVQNIDAAAMELYLGYRHYEYDHPTISYQDIDVLLAGARMKF